MEIRGLGMPVQQQLAEKLERLAASHVVRRIQQLGVLCKHLEPAKYLEYTRCNSADYLGWLGYTPF